LVNKNLQPIWNEPRKELVVHVKCLMCGFIDLEVKLEPNNYGGFDLPDTLCPKCFCILDKNANGRKSNDNRS
jgi:DNA polymerase III alpha subunit (gram-positive type)